jgi:hypothetical protein
LRFTLTGLELNPVALLLRLRDLLPRTSLGDTRLPRLRMTKSEIRKVVHVLLRRTLLQRYLRALQVLASLIHISGSCLLRQRISRNFLYFRAGLIELIAMHWGRRTSCDQCH